MDGVAGLFYRAEHYFDKEVSEAECRSELVICEDDVNKRVGLCIYECDNSVVASVKDLFGIGSSDDCIDDCPYNFKSAKADCVDEYSFCLEIVKEEAPRKITVLPSEVELKTSCSNSRLSCYETAKSDLGGCKDDCRNGISANVKQFLDVESLSECLKGCENSYDENIPKCTNSHEQCDK